MVVARSYTLYICTYWWPNALTHSGNALTNDHDSSRYCTQEIAEDLALWWIAAGSGYDTLYIGTYIYS